MARLQTALLLYAVALFGILCHSASALPALSSPLENRGSSSLTTLTTSQISAYTPYTYYAAAGYCNPNTTFTWTCGANCKANPSFIPVSTGGDGSLTQYWYVGYDPTLNEVIVAHQGTYSSNILNLLEDATFVQRELNSNLFPGVSSSIKVHSGFADSQERSANDIKNGVLAALALAKQKTTKVTVVGHSLGAAIALLDAVYLPLQISGITTRFVGYGLPRIGNQAFADYVDSLSAKLSVTHINHTEDIVPILPGRGLGFHHPSGEIHIQDSGAWVSCPGQDNTSSKCSTGDVWSIFVGNIGDHKGPYGNVVIAADTCA